MCDGFGITPDTFLNCLCVQPRFIEIYGSSRSVGTFVEGAALQEIYSILATIRWWIGTRYILLTQAFTKITYSGVHGALSSSQRLLRQARTPHRSINPVMASYGYLLNPQPVISGQDALSLITIYPRPDEHRILLQHSADADRSPAKNTLLTHPHTTINKRGSQQHTQKNNWITVYPFTHSVTGKPLFCSNRRMGAATSSSHPSILFAGGEYDILNLLSKRRISCRQRV